MTMPRLAPLALLFLPALAAAQAPVPDRLSGEQRLALHCGAVFAIAARAPQAAPGQAARGREFFVRTAARIMDETGMTREEIRAAAMADAATTLAALPPEPARAPALARQIDGCLPLLDTVVPPLDAGRSP
ncbi:MAG: hypothetical protein KGL44_04295 [Sphingomonadales bacterium]|nr:hypothetical protein [Sphingomonadales bacterium]